MKLVIVPLALGELHDAAAFYAASANAELGLAFVTELDRAVSGILADPYVGAVSVGPDAAIFFAGFPTAFSITLWSTKYGSLRSHITGGVLPTGQVASSALQHVPGTTPSCSSGPAP